ncbi:MAG: prepilin-type N-terminal cleavage/methylation domain-containing protein, partial [Planctomycetes bacterium]|nr:prepilin-type N-terminal cleavage/methylation domain-containing protein [Planctomycetota bacterium]
YKGFSLIEVMISAGILAVGFVLIAGAFSVGVKLTATATERTIGLAAAEEAFAKIRLYGVDAFDGDWPGGSKSVRYSLVANFGINLDLYIADFSAAADPAAAMKAAYDRASEEYNYPSTHLVDRKKYRWSALCRDLGGNQLQVTVFVCRLTGLGIIYPNVDRNGRLVDDPDPLTTEYPTALRMKRDMAAPADPAELTDNIINIDVSLTNPDLPADFSIAEYVKYVTAGSTLVDDRTGELMYVIGRDGPKITLLGNVDETSFNPDRLGSHFWVVPPSVKTNLSVDGRYPCVEVYQRVITF